MKKLFLLLSLALPLAMWGQYTIGSRSFLPPSSSGKTISFVQYGPSSNNFGGTTSSTTFSSNTAAGDNILVCAVWAGSTTGVNLVSVSDTQGASYTVDTATYVHSGGVSYAEIGTECAHSTTLTTAAADTVTCTISGSDYLYCALVEVNPDGGTLSLDTSATNVGTATYTPNGGSATPAQVGEFAFSGIEVGDNAGAGGITSGTGWTIGDSQGGGSASEATEYQTLSATSTITADYTLLSESINYAANLAIYEAH